MTATKPTETFTKIAVPLAGLLFIIPTLISFVHNVIQPDWTSTIIRLMFTIIFTIETEFIGMFQHDYLWHSKWLWFIHASHHHQTAPVGSAPAESLQIKDKKPFPINIHPFEWNDIFPIIFATITSNATSWAQSGPHTLLKDCVFGISMGFVFHGIAYFVGHDLCAHERGGTALAEWLKRHFPFIIHYADIHNQYHHNVTKSTDGDNDPYGEPYAFWVGPQEVEAMKRNEKYCVPLWCKIIFACAFAVMGYAATAPATAAVVTTATL